MTVIIVMAITLAALYLAVSLFVWLFSGVMELGDDRTADGIEETILLVKSGGLLWLPLLMRSTKESLREEEERLRDMRKWEK